MPSAIEFSDIQAGRWLHIFHNSISLFSISTSYAYFDCHLPTILLYFLFIEERYLFRAAAYSAYLLPPWLRVAFFVDATI